LIALPDFRQFDDEKQPVRGYVASASLDAERRPVSIPEVRGRLVRDFPPDGLWPTPAEGPLFAKALCGEVRVLMDGPEWTQISQYHAGVELLGFTQPIGFLRGQLRCVLRQIVKRDASLFLRAGPTWADEAIVSSIPSEFVRREAPGSAFWERFKSPSSFYWLIQSEGKATCEEWIFERRPIDHPRLPVEPGDVGLRLSRRMPIDTDKGKVSASFDARYRPAADGRPGELRVRGPAYRPVPGSRRTKSEPWGDDCETRYGFLGVSSTAVRLYPEGPPGDNVVAWHPGDEEPWFLSKDACKKLENAANEVLQADIAALPDGETHLECYSPTGPVFPK
jgi:hypothetical protein